MSMEMTAYHAMWSTMRTPEQRRVSRATLRRIAEFARPHRRLLLAFLVVSVLAAALAVATPLMAGRVVNAITDGDAESVVLRWALLIAGAAVATALLGLLTRWFSSRLGEGLILDLRREVFSHVLQMPIAFFTRTRTGALVSRLNNDVLGAQRAFSQTLSGLVTNVVALALTLAAMLSLSWPITLCALVLLPVFVLPARRRGRQMAALQREAAEHNAAMGTRMTERFSAPGAQLVKLFADPDVETAEFVARAERVRDIGVRTAMAQAVFVTALTLVSALALAMVYGFGGTLASRGQLDAGTVVSLGFLITGLYVPLTGLASARVEVMGALVSFERVFEVLDLQPLIQEAPDAVDLPEGSLDVTFETVDFSYPTAGQVSLASLEDVAVLDDRVEEQVLHEVAFTVPAGTMTALVGSSGAGKSTVAQLATRLQDVDAGRVQIGGTDVRQVRFASLRGAVSLVSQDGHLFHDTIRANLQLAAPGADDEAVHDALRQARLDTLVAAMPAGLDTVVGERGYRLSGGERQRLTIARLLLARPRVVVLDEATAHLDSTSEAAVQAALATALAGRTSIVIAHRLSTVRAADQICVLEAGRVVERGTHAELLAADGRYAELYRTQFATDAQEGSDSNRSISDSASATSA